MRAFPVTDIGSDRSLSLVSALHQEHDSTCTRRAAELEARVMRLRAELQEAESALEMERTRQPAPGDFVRCPLTNFFGRVTKVTPRTSGRPWIEIIPYLGPELPGHSAMDLYDSWELIDPPSQEAGSGDGSHRLPTISPFLPPTRRALSPPSDDDEIEMSLKRLWLPTTGISS